MKKAQREKRSLVFLASLLVACFLLITSVFAACSDKKENPPAESGKEVGTYYYDTNGDQNRENQLILAEGLKFTFMPENGENHIGSYSLSEGTLTLTDGEWVQTATYNDNETISLTYNSTQMTFLRKVAYTVSFDTGNGSTVPSQTVINGRMASKPADPALNGSTFLGWFADSAFTTPYSFGSLPITANTTLYARWAQNSADGIEYTINYDLGYDGAEAIPADTTVGGKLYNVATPAERSGYTFGGWWISMENEADRLSYSFEDPDETSGGTVFTADTTLFAIWHENSATLSAAPAVNVSQSRASWNSVSGATSYSVEIVAPDGISDSIPTSSTNISVTDRFTQTGVYQLSVTALNAGGSAVSETAVRYFVNNGLNRVSGVRVTEPDTLVYRGVEGAERYLITIDCGNKDHEHNKVAFNNGTSLYYNFSNCDMQPGGIKFTIEAVAEGYAPSKTTYVFERNLAAVTGADVTENDVVVWDSVAGASYYNVTIGEDTYTTMDTSFSLREMAAGKYEIGITPVAKGYNSPEAEKLTYEKTAPALPSDIRLVGTTLTWTVAPDATYAIVYGNNTTAVTGTSGSFDLETLTGLTWTDEGRYTVQLQVTQGNASALSDEFTFIYNALEPTLTYSGSVLSWKPVAGATEYQVSINGKLIATITNGESSLKIDSLATSGLNTLEVRFMNATGALSDPATLQVYALAVTFNSNNGDSETLYKAVGDELTPPAASSMVGHDFGAWYTTPAGPATNGAVYSSPFFNGPSELVLYAYYQPKEYTVIFSGDNLGELESGTVTYGQNFSLDVPAAPSNGTSAFGGWYSGPYGSGIQYTDAYGNSTRTWNLTEDNVTLYAFWVDEVLSYQAIGGNYQVSAGDRINLVQTVTIPSQYNGLPVTEVSANAFYGCTSLTDIYIPDTINIVPSSAFTGCSSLVNIHVYDAGAVDPRYESHDGVLYDRGIDKTYLRPVYMPAAKTGSYTIPDGVDQIPANAFKGSGISRVVIPQSVTVIGQEAFANCINLATVTFVNPSASGQLSVGNRAFMNCFSLTNITFPARLSQIATSRVNDNMLGSFSSLDDLTANADDAFLIDKDAIEVENESDLDTQLVAVNVARGSGATYSSADGVLFRNNGSELVYFPAAKDAENYAIPSTTTRICESAFLDTSLSGTLTIPISVQTIDRFAFAATDITEVVFEGRAGAAGLSTGIGAYAFYNCNSLAELTFEENSIVSTIGEGAFMDTEELTDITIPSTVTEIGDRAFAWSEYEDEEYDEDYTKDLSITFASGDDSTLADLYLGNAIFLGCEIDELALPANAVISTGFFNGIVLGYNALSVSENNDTMAVENDAIYLKSTTGSLDTLLLYVGSDEVFDFTDEEGNVINVLTIADGAFINNDDIVEVTIPASVTTIGNSAFYGVDLETLNFAQGGTGVLVIGDYAFYGNRISAINLPDERSITIGEYAFADSDYTRTIDLGGTVTVGDYAFKTGTDPYSITLTITSSVVTIGEHAFEGDDSYGYGTVNFEEGSHLETIGRYAFADNNFTSFNVPASVTSIAGFAFDNCTALESLTFEEGDKPLVFGNPEGGTDRLDYDYPVEPVLGGVSGLTEIHFPGRLTELGNYALYDTNEYVYSSDGSYYAGLETVTFGAYGNNTEEFTASKLTTIGNGAFYDTTVTSLTIPASVTLVEANAFAGSDISSITFESIADAPAQLVIQSGVFNECNSLTNITLPSSLLTLEDGVFTGSSYSTLASITVEEGCANYASEDGVLYNGDLTELLFCPPAKTEVVVAAETEVIAANAFAYSKATSVTFETGSKLTEIGDRAFASSSLTSIVIPDSVTTLGNNVFEYSSIEEITLPASLESFNSNIIYGCENVTSISINNGVNFAVDSENGYVFNADRTVLYYHIPNAAKTEYVVPEGVKEIGDNAFYNDSYITKITLPASLTRIGNGALRRTALTTVVFTAGGTEALAIGEYALGDNDSLTSIALPARINAIGNNAFYDTALTSITFGGENSQLRTIGNYSFYGTALTSVTLPSSVVSIGDYAFYRCSNLTTVTLNEGLLEIGDYAFAAQTSEAYADEADSSLETVNLPSTLTTMGDGIFAYDYALKNVNFAANSQITSLPGTTFEGCTGLEAIQLPASLTEITGRTQTSYGREGRGLFEGLTALKSVTFEEGSRLVSIGAMAFADSGLESIIIPSSVTTISYEAFANTNITTITIPRTVTIIDSYAFNGCRNLESVYINANITELMDYTFQSCTSLKILSLPASLQTISSTALRGCNITQFMVADGSEHFAVDERSGGLFNADYTELYMLPAGITEFVVPSTLTADNLSSILSNYSSITSISVENGNSVYIAQENVLYNSHTWDIAFLPNGMTEIELPAEITTLSDSTIEALRSCSTLEEIRIEQSQTPVTRDFNVSNNVIYNTDWNILLIPAALKEYVIPNEVTVIPFYLPAYPQLPGSYYEEVFTFGDVNSSVTKITYESDRPEDSTLTIEGYTGSYYSAFGNMENLTTVELPANTSIGNYAFAYSSNLSSITLSEGSENSIGNYAFQGTALTSMVIPEGYTTLGNNIFSGLTLESLSLPASLTTMSTSTLSGCSVGSLTLAAGNESFVYEDNMLTSADGNNVYLITDGLTTFNFTASMTSSSIVTMLSNITTLESVTVDEGNTAYKAYHGVLYNRYDEIELIPKAMTEFILASEIDEISASYSSDLMFVGSNIEKITYVPGETYNLTIEGGYSSGSPFSGADKLTTIELPAGTILSDYAFKGLTTVTSINLEGVTRLGYYCFEDCTISEITIPSSVTSTDYYPFYGWTADQTIYLPFAEGEVPSGWNSNWSYNCDAKIVYADTTVTE